MKYVIVGTGGTGGCIGASLASGGQDVTFIARGDHLHTLRESGLYLESDLKGMLYIQPVQACTTEEYDQIADVILVCVKFYSLSSILPLLQKASDEHTVIIPILNVYGTGQLLSQQLPGKCVLDGCFYGSCYISAPGKIRHVGKRLQLVFGPRKGQQADMQMLKRIEKDLNDCGIDACLSDDIGRDTFIKYALISAYAACGAYYNATAGQIAQTPEYMQTYLSLLSEMDQLAAALHMQLDEPLVQKHQKSLLTFAPETTASLQKDLAANKQSEIDGIVFRVVRLGAGQGLKMPTYRKIAQAFGFDE